jgi:hypothetical protein
MAVYTIVLGGACAVAAYSEKYRRNQDEIDDRLMERYSSNMREQHEKIPKITEAIRGQDVRLDGTMNTWVWGGKAALPVGGPTGRAHRANGLVPTNNAQESDDENPTSNTETEGEIDDESKLSNKERKRRRKERKQKRILEREAAQKHLEAQRQKLVLQSVAAGAAVGAVAVGISLFVGNGKK